METIQSAKDNVKMIYHALEEKKAKDISIIDISKLTVMADYFIIASADNVRQTSALADYVEEVCDKIGLKPRQIEGRGSANWILMDYNDIIVHIFDHENRLFYDLEKIWRDGRTIVNIDEL